MTDVTPLPQTIESPDDEATWPPEGAPMRWRYAVTRAEFGGPLVPPEFGSQDAEAVAIAESEGTVHVLWRWI